ncbi:caspase-3-like isoform X3 [Lethenteron reissneri]|uniref:caspase-3-like isoform X3 n=1 Tax=Lethenteron reissneri TaxID=7753 RepID=UPI002AB6C17F|nr:caspase-3-like isoform X3 [Lethenteron reissneri]
MVKPPYRRASRVQRQRGLLISEAAMDSKDGRKAINLPNIFRGAGTYGKLGDQKLTDDIDWTSSAQYNMHFQVKSKCIIINNENFSPQTGMNRRKGTDRDAMQLKVCFVSLGFQVESYKDLTCMQMVDNLKKASSEDHGTRACFVCAILSHGEEGVLYGTDGTLPVSILAEIFSEKHCPSLAGKPKLFFIQACRGSMFDEGVDHVDGLGRSDDTDNRGHSKPVEDSLLPRYNVIQPDFLYAFSTVPGYYSWRNEERGSWFIQSLCEELLRNSSQLELVKILVCVNRRVATQYVSCSRDITYNDKKQIPCIMSMLTREFYFK